MTVVFLILGTFKCLSYWFAVLGIFIDVFIYCILSKFNKDEDDNFILSILSPILIVSIIIYFVFKGISYLYKKPIDYIYYKIYGIKLERFLIKNNLYSQFMNVLNNNLHITFKEYIKICPPKEYILDVSIYDDDTFSPYVDKWRRILDGE